MTLRGEKKSLRFRQENKLEPMSTSRVQAWLQVPRHHFVERELDVLDVALQMAARKHGGAVPDSLVVDVSQSVDRLSWKTDGRVMSLHRGMKSVYRGKILNLPTCFRLMGWPNAEDIVMPEGLTNSGLDRMLSNMIAVPVIGAVLMAALSEPIEESD